VSAHAYTAAELEVVARRLGGADKTGGGWTCRCPVHDDRTPSLSLSLGEGGRLLWHCHAGCDQAAVLAGLRTAGVLLNGDARPAERRPKARGRGRIVASYPYVDEAGTLLFEVSASSPRLHASAGRTGRRLMEAGRRTRAVLFRLPEVSRREVFSRGREGRPQRRRGRLCGTTSPQGAKFWRDELAAPLAGKRWRSCPTTTRRGPHAPQVAARPGGGAASVKVVELGGLPPKGDRLGLARGPRTHRRRVAGAGRRGAGVGSRRSGTGRRTRPRRAPPRPRRTRTGGRSSASTAAGCTATPPTPPRRSAPRPTPTPSRASTGGAACSRGPGAIHNGTELERGGRPPLPRRARHPPRRRRLPRLRPDQARPVGEVRQALRGVGVRRTPPPT
jgi:hypothetical protein